MPEFTRVLLYGQDSLLLDTRRMVIESAGHRVWIASDFEGMDCQDLFNQIDLVILCHTLTSEQCARAFDLARSRRPRVGVLVLTAGSGGGTSNSPDLALDSMHGPQKLIAAVREFVVSDDPHWAHFF